MFLPLICIVAAYSIGGLSLAIAILSYLLHYLRSFCGTTKKPTKDNRINIAIKGVIHGNTKIACRASTRTPKYLNSNTIQSP